MKAYWIGHVNVTKPDSYAEYGKLAGPAIEKHGGRFLARGGKSATLEGDKYGMAEKHLYSCFDFRLRSDIRLGELAPPPRLIRDQ